MNKKAILITGGAGFIGSNFVNYLLSRYGNYFIVNLDNLTEAANLSYLSAVEANPNYLFIKGDICNSSLVDSIFVNHDIRAVIHFAAESHVDNSILNPEKFIHTNINGTFTLLNAACKHWLKNSFKHKDGYEDTRFHHISTDEVYGTLGKEGYFTESTPYAPNSPYSASKASSDMLVRSYHHTFGLNTVTSNCSNNYGPNQHDEKLIPTIIRSALLGKPIPIYGNGLNIRDWLYVEDNCKAIDKMFHNGNKGESYIVGGNSEKTNLEVAQTICNILDELKPKTTFYSNQITFVKDRPGHDFRYAVDFRKISEQLHWKPEESFETGLKKTVEYYLRKE